LRTLSVAAVLASIALAIPPNAAAYKLAPQGASIERKLVRKDQSVIDRAAAVIARSSIEKLGEPVHEEITNRMLGCEGDAAICADWEFDPGAAYILAGVRWNDDPPFEFAKGHGAYGGCKIENVIRLVTFPECWVNVFNDGKRKAERRQPIDRRTAPILIRSHFGDLQFLHAMASGDGEPANDTRSKVMSWMEFTWKVATLKINSDAVVVDTKVPGIREIFIGHGWNVQDLFAQGNPHIRKPKYMAEVAFGSLLHVVQDSFSAAHVRREKPVHGRKCSGTAADRLAPGRIIQFYSYLNQDEKAHAKEDTREAFAAHWSDVRPSVVDVGRVLNEFFEKQLDWEAVQPYLACVFELSTNAQPSSAGDRFQRQ
jgi:hypothetical protein